MCVAGGVTNFVSTGSKFTEFFFGYFRILHQTVSLTNKNKGGRKRSFFSIRCFETLTHGKRVVKSVGDRVLRVVVMFDCGTVFVTTEVSVGIENLLY